MRDMLNMVSTIQCLGLQNSSKVSPKNHSMEWDCAICSIPRRKVWIEQYDSICIFKYTLQVINNHSWFFDLLFDRPKGRF